MNEIKSMMWRTYLDSSWKILILSWRPPRRKNHLHHYRGIEGHPPERVRMKERERERERERASERGREGERRKKDKGKREEKSSTVRDGDKFSFVLLLVIYSP